jgi:hypothetical protein
MTSTPTPLAPAVTLLADHLDAALAAGEDLVAVASAWPPAAAPRRHATSADIARLRHAQRATVEAVRAAEMRLLGRVLKARERAEELARIASPFKPLVRLFAAGTAVLADAVPACGDAAEHDFASGDSLLAYWRSRGLVDDETASLADDAVLTIDDAFLVAGLAPLGVVMDLVAMLLDALDAHYDLYPETMAAADTADAATVELVTAGAAEAA